MTDVLFIELGAVVTEIKGPNWCSIEPYCNLNPPTYDPDNRVAVNFADSLGHASLENVKYDQIVYPAGNRVQIGPGWPGGGYEGILCVRENFVRTYVDSNNNSTLAIAANTLSGPRCRYQVIASIADDKEVRRYHGFWAQVISTNNGIDFKLVNLNGDIIGNSITYDPSDVNKAVKFYVGNQSNSVDGYDVGANIVDGNVVAGDKRAVFMNLDAFDPIDVTWIIAAAPKLPHSAGL
jgi:hypothetical protein